MASSGNPLRSTLKRLSGGFGSSAPAGHEANWVQTMPGKGFNVLLWLYGPLEPWFNRTWKPDDFERVE
jgi:hypothetical protein